MKKVGGIIAIVIFFLILVSLVVIKLLPSHSNTQTTTQTQDVFKTISAPQVTIQNDTPESVVFSCYQWYLYYVSNHAVAFGEISKQPQITQCFTQQFISTWPNLDVDPITQSQDYLPSWNKNFQLNTVSQSVRSIDFRVLFGTGTETQTLTVHTIKDGAVWRIDSVSK